VKAFDWAGVVSVGLRRCSRVSPGGWLGTSLSLLDMSMGKGIMADTGMTM